MSNPLNGGFMFAPSSQINDSNNDSLLFNMNHNKS